MNRTGTGFRTAGIAALGFAALLLAGCGAAAGQAAGGGACVAGKAATGTNANIPQEPASGVATIAGKCWAKIGGTAITTAVIGSAPSGTSSTWKAAWTPKALYIWTHVHTGRKLINSNTASPWEDDSVEVYLSGTNDQSGSYVAGTGQILINSGGLTNSSFGTDHSQLPTAGATELEATTKGGYSTLLIMPWSDLGAAAKAKTQIGFTIGVDFPGSGATKRHGQTMWLGTNKNYQSDTGWGTLTLA